MEGFCLIYHKIDSRFSLKQRSGRVIFFSLLFRTCLSLYHYGEAKTQTLSGKLVLPGILSLGVATVNILIYIFPRFNSVHVN